MKRTGTKNIAFIDAQNVHYGTTKCTDCARKLGIDLKKMTLMQCVCGKAWKINLQKFRHYLRDKYKITEAYFFLGTMQPEYEDLYTEVKAAGFITIFKEHHTFAKSSKKGNVDTDIVFEVMKQLVDNKNFNKIVLVSGDGDYTKLVQYLLTKQKFLKILFPNKQFASALYKQFGSEYFDYLINAKKYFGEHEKEKGS